MKRRDFLNSSVIAGAVALVTPPTLRASESRAHTRQWFASRLHQQFDIATPGGTVSAELIGINEGPKAEGLDQFTTMFRVPAGSDVEGLRTVAHSGDQFPLMFDRSRESGASKICQAPFSLLV